MAYNPPTNVVTVETPYLSLVIQADPQWARDKYWAVEYETAQRNLWANPYQRGAYNRLGNTYAVGAAQGQPDPLIAAALAPTAGDASPGLYSGVPDGNGWA